MKIPTPASLPWNWGAGETSGLIAEADGTTVMSVSVTENTGAHKEFYKNLGYAVYAANKLPGVLAELEEHQAATWNSILATVRDRLEDEQAASPYKVLLGQVLTGLDEYVQATIFKDAPPTTSITQQLRAALEAKREEANRQNIMAGRVLDRVRNERDGLHRTLRAVRALIDRSQPVDLPGAIMAIDAALPAETRTA
jgi:hypothetical protein